MALPRGFAAFTKIQNNLNSFTLLNLPAFPSSAVNAFSALA